MRDLIYLVHRLPYPPNKGDKLRSYRLLRYLAEHHRVHLGTFIDTADDVENVDSLRSWCVDICAPRLRPPFHRMKSLLALATGEPLTLAYYRSPILRQWIMNTVRERGIDTCVVFCSAMAQYVMRMPTLSNMLIDFVDVDSTKWTQFADRHAWPFSTLYRREGARLLAFERTAAQRAKKSIFVTEAEAALFRTLAPESAGRVEVIGNGVNADYFSPDIAFASPFSPSVFPVVFTGAMDYWPNVDAVQWFASEMLPALRSRHPDVHLAIVGMHPTREVRALAGEFVTVTGTVPDVRPYLQHAGVVIAPLRVARGVQNKILEAMAMGRPVVTSDACISGIEAELGRDFLAASTPSEFVERINALVESPSLRIGIGTNARRRILSTYTWTARLSRIGELLEGRGTLRMPPTRGETLHYSPSIPHR